MPLFSVIIPLYNKAPYVRKTVESVLGQTLGDYELVIVDNGSNDGSSEIVAGFSDPRIQIVRLEENVGVSNARNKGVELSTAPYVTFLDADDWWEPTFLEEMAALTERHPGAGIYGTGYYIVKNGKKRVAPIGVEDGFTEGEINYCRVYAKTLCMPLTSISICMPRAVFDETGGFPAGIKLGEDFLLWLQVALKHKVVLLNKPLSNYNQDVDVTYRGTHHLHKPNEHMLWNLGYLEPEEKTNHDYKQLIDNLRTYSLWPYYIDREYHTAAQQELSKVEWGKQTSHWRKLYNRPLWLMRIHNRLFKVAIRIKKSLR